MSNIIINACKYKGYFVIVHLRKPIFFCKNTESQQFKSEIFR